MRYFPLLALTLTFAACKTETPAADAAAPIVAVAGFDSYGTALTDTSDARTAESVTADGAALDGQTVTVAGTLRNVCQMAGCWATIETPSGTIRITVPKKATAPTPGRCPRTSPGGAWWPPANSRRARSAPRRPSTWPRNRRRRRRLDWLQGHA